MKTKTFDCIKMKDDAQRRRAGAMRGLTTKQRLEYYRTAYEQLLDRRARLAGYVEPSSKSGVDAEFETNCHD